MAVGVHGAAVLPETGGSHFNGPPFLSVLSVLSDAMSDRPELVALVALMPEALGLNLPLSSRLN
jgi:hypothetical protein